MMILGICLIFQHVSFKYIFKLLQYACGVSAGDSYFNKPCFVLKKNMEAIFAF